MISDILTVLCQLTLMALIGYQWLLLRRAAHWLKESFEREEAMSRELEKTTALLDRSIGQLQRMAAHIETAPNAAPRKTTIENQ